MCDFTISLYSAATLIGASDRIRQIRFRRTPRSVIGWASHADPDDQMQDRYKRLLALRGPSGASLPRVEMAMRLV